MTDILKLSAYFAERERAGAAFLADALLDLYATGGVATSIALRGIASFGPHRIVRTDQSLSLSENLPITVIATDTAERIRAVADDAVGLIGRGLVTLERARLQPAADGAVRLSVYLGRQQRLGGRPADLATTALLHRLGFAAAVVHLGVDGTVDGRRRRAKFFSRNADVPVLVLGIGTAEQAAAAVAALEGLRVTAERATICKRAGQLLAPPPSLPSADGGGLGLFQKLTVFTEEDARHGGRPIHRALVQRLIEGGQASGATVQRGIWGFTGPGDPHGDRMFALGRRVPVTTVLIDTPDVIARSFEIVDELTAEQGLVTCESIPAMVALDGADRYGGTALARHPFQAG